ncbi:hypothetical protein ABW636_11595 [Aquimarina sp. 2201CG1-2-11]|uniref:hypothetical protein n=1 Tax=Aquimarina discodermiae TaxID=3231043 RepID=UPI00346211A4
MQQHSKKNNIRIYLIIASAVFGFLILPALPMIMMSPMLFDSPGSENSIPTVTLAISLITYPITTIIGSIIAWILFTKKKYLIAIIFASVPILNILVGILTIIYMAFFCGGNLGC